MDLLEHQGKELLSAAGVPVLAGRVASTAAEAVAAAESIGYPVAVKAQVRVGGRGKAGGIAVVADAHACRAAADRILGMTIGGLPVRRVLVESGCEPEHEWYAAFTFDRSTRRHVALLSAEGGVDIEQVAAIRPEALARLAVDPLDGFSSTDAARLVDLAGLGGAGAGAGAGAEMLEAVAAVLVLLYGAYAEADAELLEVNPLVATAGGDVLALDAKVTLDESAAFRHPEWEQWRIADEDLDPRERLARSRGLTYVGLDGTVGVIGNGAGLVMSTLDVIAAAGGRAANFLDIGGGASADVMTAALEVVVSDPAVHSVFVNIFGGITRGDEVARGIIEALSRLDLRRPIVVRLDGTNAEEGLRLLAAHESDLLQFRPTMAEAARRAVELAEVASA